MWFFGKSKKDKKVESQSLLINKSSSDLIAAAKETTRMAVELVTTLQLQAEDATKQLISTSNLVQDALIATTHTGIITSANTAACRLLNTSENYLIGSRLTDFFLVSSEMTEVFSYISVYSQITMEYDIELSASITVSPKYDGSMTYILLIKDTALENQLEEIRLKYEAIKNSNTSAIFVLDFRYEVIELNDEARSICKMSTVKFDNTILTTDVITIAAIEYSVESSVITHNGKTCYVVIMSEICEC